MRGRRTECCWELSAAQHLFITSCVVICVASTSVSTTTRAITITITQLIQKYDIACACKGIQVCVRDRERYRESVRAAVEAGVEGR